MDQPVVPAHVAPSRIAAVAAHAPGLSLCIALAVCSLELARQPFLAGYGLNALTLALLMGMVLGNLPAVSIGRGCDAGVGLAKQHLLRWGVVVYGLRLTLQDVGHFGAAGVLVDVLVLSTTFALAYGIGTRWLRLDPATAMLIGAGSAICGAAAVLATQPAVRARDEQTTVAIATVVIFGTIAVFLYPILYQQSWSWLPAAGHYGLYVGSTVHEVAQVLAIGASLGPDAERSALIEKMVRVLMLGPFLLIVATASAKRRAGAAERFRLGAALPWFASAFCAVVALNSVVRMPVAVRTAGSVLDTALLATAMAGLGLSTKIAMMRRAGSRPLLLALLLFTWLVAGGAAINGLVLAMLDRL